MAAQSDAFDDVEPDEDDCGCPGCDTETCDCSVLDEDWGDCGCSTCPRGCGYCECCCDCGNGGLGDEEPWDEDEAEGED